ncbi:MAG: endonuclease [Acidimicrobiaceae bacterium]
MPEGDTIHRSAARLRSALEGKPLVRFEAPRAVGRPPRPGTVIETVEAVGKHLLIRFADGTTLRTHMRMTGSWHLYRTGERWQRPRHLARAVVEVEGWVAVCFSAPVVELERGDERIAHLGPDLTNPEVTDADIEVAVERMATCSGPGDEIGAVLLDQRVACGVGNVYKSEVLFACAIDPFATVAAVTLEDRRRLLSTASKLLRANLGSGPRRTTPEGLAVYGRRGQPCPRCGTPIRMRRQGEQARSTYWCPTCQT